MGNKLYYYSVEIFTSVLASFLVTVTLLDISEVNLLSRVRLFAIPWTVTYQALPFMEFSRQEYWSGLLFPSPEDLPNPGVKPSSPTLQADFTV